MGGYSGYQYAQANGLDPFMYMIGGAIIGGASGWYGYQLSTASATLSATASSMINSFGWEIMTGGQSQFQIGFGFANWNVDGGSFKMADFSGNLVMIFLQFQGILDCLMILKKLSMKFLNQKVSKNGMMICKL